MAGVGRRRVSGGKGDQSAIGLRHYHWTWGHRPGPVIIFGPVFSWARAQLECWVFNPNLGDVMVGRGGERRLKEPFGTIVQHLVGGIGKARNEACKIRFSSMSTELEEC
ncbi:hypothetical protein CRG98_038658 [Punica granatum]|uniref:Uncharacterized protein n=1 Tax=Punica granatum TaxID=22663 RepID=A0A2I0IBU4_PUNGR|nr:hypothetical protein CRG98_038658 [Punica granatum]